MSQWQGDMRHEMQQEYFGGGAGGTAISSTKCIEPFTTQINPWISQPATTGLVQVNLGPRLLPDGSVVLGGMTYRYEGGQWVVKL